MRDGRKSNSVGNLAKVGTPILVGSGLVFLGVRDLWSGKSLAVETAESTKRGRAGSKRSRSARGRARNARASGA